MPHQIKWYPHGIVRTFTGKVTAHEILRSNMDIHGSEQFDSLRYQIVDFTMAEKYEATILDVRKIAYMGKAAAQSNPRIKVAIVLPDEMNPYFVEYMTHAQSGPWKTKLFDSLGEAQSWVVEETGITNEIRDFA